MGTGNGCPSLPPCANENRAGSEKREGVPCITSLTNVSDWSVRGPTPSSVSNVSKSFTPFSWASSSAAPKRFVFTSSGRTS